MQVKQNTGIGAELTAEPPADVVLPFFFAVVGQREKKVAYDKFHLVRMFLIEPGAAEIVSRQGIQRLEQLLCAAFPEIQQCHGCNVEFIRWQIVEERVVQVIINDIVAEPEGEITVEFRLEPTVVVPEPFQHVKSLFGGVDSDLIEQFVQIDEDERK